MNRKKKRDRQAEMEKSMLLTPEKLKKKKKKKRIRTAVVILCGIVMAAGIMAASFQVVKAIGKSSLRYDSQTVGVELDQAVEELTETEQKEWQKGWVKYKGEIYAYNEDIMTFLFMGIDKNAEVVEVAEGTDGGQADALFLLALNPHDKTIRVIGINRNTMTDVDLYSKEGAYMSTVTAQIAVQHGFGNGVEESCEYQVNAVRGLFYNLPIHGYCAINMDAVIELTDLLGGIRLTALEDVRNTRFHEDGGAYVIREGETAVLDGRQAYSYVRYRDVNVSGSADMRLKRQQQFLEQFIAVTKEEISRDITFPMKLYNAVIPQMVTDITVEEVTYLASVAGGYRFDSSQICSLKGENVQGEKFEEYYVDEKALYELILDIFYEPVSQ